MLSLDSSPAPCTHPGIHPNFSRQKLGPHRPPLIHPPRRSSTLTEGAPVCHQDKTIWLYFMSLSKSRWELDVTVAQFPHDLVLCSSDSAPHTEQLLQDVHEQSPPVTATLMGNCKCAAKSENFVLFSNPKLLTSNSSLHKNILSHGCRMTFINTIQSLWKGQEETQKYLLNKSFWMTEWRESDTFCECTIHCRANASTCKSWN